MGFSFTIPCFGLGLSWDDALSSFFFSAPFFVSVFAPCAGFFVPCFLLAMAKARLLTAFFSDWLVLPIDFGFGEADGRLLASSFGTSRLFASRFFSARLLVRGDSTFGVASCRLEAEMGFGTVLPEALGVVQKSNSANFRSFGDPLKLANMFPPIKGFAIVFPGSTTALLPTAVLVSAPACGLPTIGLDVAVPFTGWIADDGEFFVLLTSLENTFTSVPVLSLANGFEPGINPALVSFAVSRVGLVFTASFENARGSEATLFTLFIVDFDKSVGCTNGLFSEVRTDEKGAAFANGLLLCVWIWSRPSPFCKGLNACDDSRKEVGFGANGLSLDRRLKKPVLPKGFVCDTFIGIPELPEEGAAVFSLETPSEGG
mmetsp:Transcript_4663/g.10470  ORF Transcript_4663/g.10470 Transcript_4663/m.10470 type:complete len:373 (-) Transcript_4663:76-1194(-)